jgi:hypothetical protein
MPKDKHNKSYRQKQEDEPILSYGNWCGQGWTAGQSKPASEITPEDYNVPAVDALDSKCKTHDIGIFEAKTLEDLKRVDEKFVNDAWEHGVTGKVMSKLVEHFGPSKSLSKMPKRDHIKKQNEDTNPLTILARKIKAKRLADEEHSRNKARNMPMEETKDEFVTPQAVVPKESTISPQQDPIPDWAKQTFGEFAHSIVDPRNAEGTIGPIQEEDNEEDDLETAVELSNAFNEDPQNDDEIANEFDWEGVTERASLINSRQTTNMETVTPLASKALASSGTNTKGNGNRETLVRYNSRAEMGIFTETRTAYLPITAYFSINRTQLLTSIPLYFRVDWPFNIFTTNILAEQKLRTDYSQFHVRNVGLSNDMACNGIRRGGGSGIVVAANNTNTLPTATKDVATNSGQLFPFPTTIKGSTAAVQGTAIVQGASSYGTISDAAAIPAYRKWYAKMYQYAHCMETDWKVTYYSGDANEEFQNITVFESMDCVSEGNADRTPAGAEYGTIDHWPYLKKHNLKCRTEQNAIDRTTISGKWTPNDQRPNKMVANEEDIKTWTKLGESDFIDRNPNSYKEEVCLLHYSNPDSINQAGFFNVKIDLRYKIQFKDLATKLRWLSNADTPISISSSDCIQVPYPNNTIGIIGQPERVYCDGVIPR